MMENPLTTAQQTFIKGELLKKLRAIDGIRSDEIGPLLFAPLEAVLERVFEHTDEVRVRVGENQFVTILPGGTVQ